MPCVWYNCVKPLLSVKKFEMPKAYKFYPIKAFWGSGQGTSHHFPAQNALLGCARFLWTRRSDTNSPQPTTIRNSTKTHGSQRILIRRFNIRRSRISEDGENAMLKRLSGVRFFSWSPPLQIKSACKRLTVTPTRSIWQSRYPPAHAT